MARFLVAWAMTGLGMVGACGRTVDADERGVGVGGQAGEASLPVRSSAGAKQLDGAGAPSEPSGGVPSEAGGGGVAPGAAGESAGGRTGTRVDGLVRAGRAPLSGVVVAINGVTVVSNADGRFAVDDVAATYELAVVDEAHSVAITWAGLTTRAPRANLGAREGEHASTVSGTVSGGAGIPNPQDHLVRVIYDSAAAVDPWNFGNVALAEGSSMFELSPSWNGLVRDEGRLMALQWFASSSGPVFTGFAAQTVTVVAGKPLANVSVELQPLPLEQVYASIVVPEEYRYDLSDVHLEVGPFEVPLPLEPYVFLDAPQVGLPIGITATATRDGNFVGATLMGPPSVVNLPAPSRLLWPRAGATEVPLDAAFSWSLPQPDLIACVRWRIDGWLIVRCQDRSQTTATFPDLTSLGAPSLAGKSGTWQVIGFGPNQNMDANLDRHDDYLAIGHVDWRFAASAWGEFEARAAAP